MINSGVRAVNHFLPRFPGPFLWNSSARYTGRTGWRLDTDAAMIPLLLELRTWGVRIAASRCGGVLQEQATGTIDGGVLLVRPGDDNGGVEGGKGAREDGLVEGGTLRETLFLTEYAPTTQLEVLHTRCEDLLDPVLDLGCGRRGGLVRWLRAHARQVVGLDREAARLPGLVAADWFLVDLGRGQWGSILSHMAFSSYFMHAHLNDPEEARRCAARYMAILEALRPGGSFLYAPGLPFLETLLPSDRYEVARFRVEAPFGLEAERKLEQAFGGPVLYAVKVTRRVGTDSRA